MPNALEQLDERGYAVVDLDIDFELRKQTAILGNRTIDIAMDKPDIHTALTFDLAPGMPIYNSTGFDLRGPRESSDDSVYFHSGWQTKDRFEAALHRSKRPEEVTEFLELQQEILHGVANAWTSFFREIRDGADVEHGINDLMHDYRDPNQNNHHLRIVRYKNLSQYDEENGTFSPHGDMSVVTGHLWETHGGHLRIGKYPLSEVRDDRDAERVAFAEQARSTAEAPEYDASREMVIFLGFGAVYLTNTRGEGAFEGLNAGYHFGIPPGKETLTYPDVAEDFEDDVRVTMVAFGNPKVTTPYTRYRVPSKRDCRPEAAS